jgi:hypothetical protein
MENSRRRYWKSMKDLERNWSLGPKQHQQEMVHGSPEAGMGNLS